MADEIDTAAQAVQGTPPAEGSESSEVEGKLETQDLGNEEQPGASSENQTKEEDNTPSGETGDQSGQEAKPTRVERRINSLLSKVKEVGQNQTQPLPQNNGQQPIITEEEKEAGVVDPNVLEKRIHESVQNEVQRAIQMDRVQQQYESAVKDHQADLEGIKDIDPDLEAEAVSEYEALNYRINPFTGKQEFIPAVKFSEIVNKIQSRAEKLATKRAEAIAEGNENYLKQVSSSQAVPSSGAVNGSKSVKPETTDFTEFEKHFSSKK